MRDQFNLFNSRLVVISILTVLVGIFAVTAYQYHNHVPNRHTDQSLRVALGTAPEIIYYQVRVKPGRLRPNQNSTDKGDQLKLCEEPDQNNCKAHRYVIPGDIMLASEANGNSLYVDFVNRAGKTSTGWVESDRVETLPADVSKPSRWKGLWRADDYFIEIRSSKGDGYLIAEGAGTWGLDDPERERRGGISMGDFSAKFIVHDDRAAFAVDDEDGAEQGLKFKDSHGVGQKTLPYEAVRDNICKIKLHMIGIYLVTEDNNRCGGEHFTFSGIYRNFGE